MTEVSLTAPDQWTLIKMIAHTQATDPRRPFKEILENAIEHGSNAKNVTITIRKRGKAGFVRIEDDGEGWTTLENPQNPNSRDLRRPNLYYTCSNIGNSIKAKYDKAHREGRAVGRFGIGLLSFWALGRTLTVETRSKLGDSTLTPTTKMIWEKENPKARIIDNVKPERPSHGTTTTIEGLEPAQLNLVTGRQLQKYLGKICRGLLRATQARVEIDDHGQRFKVRAEQYRGTSVPYRACPVKGHSPVELELYALPPTDEEIEIKTTVTKASEKAYDDITEIAQFNTSPWNTGKVYGYINFPDGTITPNRDGFVNDSAMAAFLSAMEEVTKKVDLFIRELEETRHRDMQSQIAKLFQQNWAEILRRLDEAWRKPGRGGPGGPPPPPPPPEYSNRSLVRVEITPKDPKVAYHSGAKLTARPLDEYGNIIDPARDIKYYWELQGPPFGDLRDRVGKQVQFAAGRTTGTTTIKVTAFEGDTQRTASTLVYVVEKIDSEEDGKRSGRVADGDLGQPPPVPLWEHMGANAARSDFNKQQNQVIVNMDHPDYLKADAGGNPALFRYNSFLIAKEITLDRWKSFGDMNEYGERFVEAISCAERVFRFDKLDMPKKRGRPRTSSIVSKAAF